MTWQRIGVFDSGRGGELMTEYLQQKYPEVTFIFRDDQAHAPYGEKSPAEILERAQAMITELLQLEVQAIVVACHTISSTCFPQAQAFSPVPLLSVNEALLAEIVEQQPQHIGLMATTASIRTGWFPRHLSESLPTHELYTVACPQLATAIDARDEAWIDRLLDEYLALLPVRQLDCLALGCTHYPAVIPQLQRKIGNQIKILDARKKIGEALAGQ